MKKTAISAALTAALSLGATTAGAVTIILLDNTAPEAGIFAAPNDATFNGAMDLQQSAPNEFRVMNGGAVSGGGEKSIVNGNQTWTFDDGTGVLTAVSGTDVVPDAAPNGGGGTGQGGTGLFLNAEFLFPGGFFGFVAPLAGTDVLAGFGEATITFDSTDNFSMYFPVMEAHWSGGTFTIGGSNGGVTFGCTGALGGTGHCSAERQIAPIDDSLGFANQFAQWEFNVQVDPAHEPPGEIPVPAAVWLFGSGLIGLVGIARRKKSSS